MHISQSRDFGGNFGELSSDDIYFLWNSEVKLFSVSDGNSNIFENTRRVKNNLYLIEYFPVCCTLNLIEK